MVETKPNQGQKQAKKRVSPQPQHQHLDSINVVLIGHHWSGKSCLMGQMINHDNPRELKMRDIGNIHEKIQPGKNSYDCNPAKQYSWLGGPISR